MASETQILYPLFVARRPAVPASDTPTVVYSPGALAEVTPMLVPADANTDIVDLTPDPDYRTEPIAIAMDDDSAAGLTPPQSRVHRAAHARPEVEPATTATRADGES
jgi:hypothetical protein